MVRATALEACELMRQRPGCLLQRRQALPRVEHVLAPRRLQEIRAGRGVHPANEAMVKTSRSPTPGAAYPDRRCGRSSHV